MSDGLSFDLKLQRPGLELSMASTLPARGVTALVGPSGAGKTTLLQALAGVIEAEGPIRLNGVRLDGVAAHRRRVGMVFQGALLFPHLSVADNVVFGARRCGTKGTAVERIVAALDIGPLMDRFPDTLSGGEARRVALARTLAASPRLLLLDEPLSGLDPARKRDILPYLARAIRVAGCPTIIVTHDTNESLALADRQIRIEAGRLGAPAPDAAVLPGVVRRDAAGACALEVAGQSVPMPFAAEPDEPWGLVIAPGRATLVAGTDALRSDAPALLPAEIVAAGDAGPRLRIAGQVLTWPLRTAIAAQFPPGTRCTVALQTPIFRLVATQDDSTIVHG